MSALAEYYNTVLVVGGEGFRCREIAELYGFKDVVVPNDIVAWDETIAPYRTFGPWERASARPRDFHNCNIEAILVFSDSRDYATDYQIIMDLLRSENGCLGTIAKNPISQRIPIYFSQGRPLSIPPPLLIFINTPLTFNRRSPVSYRAPHPPYVPRHLPSGTRSHVQIYHRS